MIEWSIGVTWLSSCCNSRYYQYFYYYFHNTTYINTVLGYASIGLNYLFNY